MNLGPLLLPNDACISVRKAASGSYLDMSNVLVKAHWDLGIDGETVMNAFNRMPQKFQNEVTYGLNVMRAMKRATDMNPGRLEKLAKSVTTSADMAWAKRADLTDPDDVENLEANLLGGYVRIDFDGQTNSRSSIWVNQQHAMIYGYHREEYQSRVAAHDFPFLMSDDDFFMQMCEDMLMILHGKTSYIKFTTTNDPDMPVLEIEVLAEIGAYGVSKLHFLTRPLPRSSFFHRVQCEGRKIGPFGPLRRGNWVLTNKIENLPIFFLGSHSVK